MFFIFLLPRRDSKIFLKCNDREKKNANKILEMIHPEYVMFSNYIQRKIIDKIISVD